ncbi:hypothetical protein C1X61_29085 [Pseudomonas sp. FW215-T2]|nr:hypothetical protein C1X61_29085 [Pseudomonas sp. FW215-T2]PNA05951.1 hypothetical protein C1X62_28685 [Pseudomonas sp. FW215-R3]
MFEGVHRFRVRHRSTVGASLLAIASGQSTLMLADTPSSRASSLLQVVCVYRDDVVKPPAPDAAGAGRRAWRGGTAAGGLRLR